MFCGEHYALVSVHSNIRFARINSDCSRKRISFQTRKKHSSTSFIISYWVLYLQVKRFSEGFFHREIPRSHLLTSEAESYNDLHDLVRNSPYYSRLPALAIECVDLDGIPDTLPILIEEVYSAIEQKPMPAFSTNLKNKSNGGINDNPLVQAVQNFSKSLFKGI